MSGPAAQPSQFNVQAMNWLFPLISINLDGAVDYISMYYARKGGRRVQLHFNMRTGSLMLKGVLLSVKRLQRGCDIG